MLISGYHICISFEEAWIGDRLHAPKAGEAEFLLILMGEWRRLTRALDPKY